MQGREHPELFGDDQRGVVRQHDATRAQPDAVGVCRDVSDEHAGGGRGDGRDVVVLGVPDAAIAAALCLPGKRHATLERVLRRLAATDEREIENRKRHRHAGPIARGG